MSKDILLYGFITIAILAIPVGCATYKFKDCKAVGHSNDWAFDSAKLLGKAVE